MNTGRILRAASGGTPALPLHAPPSLPRHAQGAPAPSLRTPREQPSAGQGTHELWAALYLPGIEPLALSQLACAALRFTPRVSLAPPDGVLLEVRAMLPRFAGLEGLRAELIQECRQLPLRPVPAFAPTALAALVAARAGKPLAGTDVGE